MTREEAVNRFKGIRESFSISIAQSKFYPSKVILNELCDMAIEALSADTVSREFYEATIKVNHGLAKENIELKAQIESADRPSGEWEIYYPFMLSVEDQKSYRIKDPKEPIPDKRFGRIRCSVCKEDKHRGNNFCSNCGADMRGKPHDD